MSPVGASSASYAYKMMFHQMVSQGGSVMNVRDIAGQTDPLIMSPVGFMGIGGNINIYV